MSIYTSINGCLTCNEGPFKQPILGGAIGTVSGLIAMASSYKPASGVQYLAYMGDKLDLVPEAYAQGVGWERMMPLMSLWQKVRDISYVFFVVILVFVGFAIMFRIRISPQAVVTIQSAIPGVILGLILITFSYAIVGFMIDIMFIVTNLVISVFRDLPEIPSVMRAPFENLPITSDAALGGILMMVGLYPVMMAFALLSILSTAVGLIISATPLTPAIGVLSGLAVFIIGAVILLIALIKVFWSIIKAYVNVVLALIFGPIQIMIGSIPGSKATSSWFKNLVANLSVPPAIFLMVMLAGYLSLLATGGFGAELPLRLWDLLSGNGAIEDIFPIIEGIASGANVIQLAGTMIVLFFVSIGLLLMAPRVADMIKAAMSGQPFGYGAALGQAMAAGGLAGFAGGTVGKVGQQGLMDLGGFLLAKGRAVQAAKQPQVKLPTTRQDWTGKIKE